MIGTPFTLATRSFFNPNLDGGWFLAVIQIVNNITILAIVLTGTALLREREHATLDHLLVLPLTPFEIILSKISSNALVVVGGTWLSLTASMGVFLAATAYLFAVNRWGFSSPHWPIRPRSLGWSRSW